MRIGTILPGSLLNAKVCLGHMLRKSNTYPINEWLGDKYAYSLPRELSQETGGSGEVVLTGTGLLAEAFNPLIASRGKDRSTFLVENIGCN